ncbi:hypothetical protein Ga0100230_020705 [Opitutaceae bacterium TAV3]|nr:hypothetical protein Ga0100230_020705 [Opitutaceae bacterium TAV3]
MKKTVLMHDQYRRESLNRRSRNLTVLHPFFMLETFKATRLAKTGISTKHYDLHRIAMVILDKVILEMGSPAKGATYTQLLEATLPTLRAANQDCTDHEADILTTLVLEHLCNEQQRTDFSVRWQFEKDDGTMEWLEHRFKIIDPHESPENETIYDASNQAINFFLSSLEVELEASQAARDAAYQHYMKRGRFEDAALVAEESRKLTIQYHTKIRRALTAIERNIFEVEYVRDTMPIIKNARQHMNERLEIDIAHITDIDQRLETTTGPAASHLPHLHHMRGIFQSSRQHNITLFREIMGAHEKFRNEQTRQKFRPRSPQAIFDPQTDALIPALKHPIGPLHEWIENNTHLFLPLQIPKPPDHADLVNKHLLNPPPSPPAPEDTAPERIEEQPARERFTKHDIAAARALIENLPHNHSTTLQNLLTEGRRQGLSDNALHHLSLKILQWFAEDAPIRVTNIPESPDPTSTPDPDLPPPNLDDPIFHGDNLAIHRPSPPPPR